MPTTVRRCLSVLILALWMAPTVSLLALGLHLVLSHRLDHHPDGPEESGHGSDLADLAAAAEHGHHHDAATTPAHDHDSVLSSSGFLARPTSGPAAVLVAPAAKSRPFADPAGSGGFARAGPSDPLFTAHCSLLL